MQSLFISNYYLINCVILRKRNRISSAVITSLRSKRGDPVSVLPDGHTCFAGSS